MKILNPFQIIFWKTKPFLVLVLAIQLSMWGSIGLDYIDIQVPLVRQLIGIVYLLFIPGTIILRVLNLGKLDSIESLLYTVGVSIAFLMFIGFFINHISLFVGIKDPISVIPLMVTTNIIFLVLSFLCYYNDKNYYNYSYTSTEKLLSPKSLFLLLIPFLAIFGSYLVNTFRNNFLIVIFLILVSLIILLNGFFDFVPKNLYSLSIFIISISLLFHNSLISTYIWGCDIQHEYYLANMVISNSYWNSGIEENANAMLSVVMLAPSISKICNINLIWTFKIIFPLLFSLLPLGMYKIFEKQTTEEVAFLSCIFFISGFEFYTEMLSLAKQQISELFFVLLILLMLNTFIENSKKMILSIIFLFSIVVSHYGFSYIFLLSLLLSLVISRFITFIKLKILNMNLSNKLNPTIKPPKRMHPTEILNINFISLAFIFAFSWYIYTSHGSSFSSIVKIGYSLCTHIFTEFFKTQGLDIVTNSASSSMRNITKYLHLISIFFISLGIFKLAIKRKIMKFNNTYVSFSFAYFMICVFGIAVPFFAVQLNTSRLYYMALIVLAPFFSIGGISFFNVIIRRSLNVFWTNSPTKRTLCFLSIFLAIFLLFNSGIMYEINGEESSSVSLNGTHYPFVYHEEDISAANWINFNRNQVNTVYADLGGTNLLLSITPHFSRISFFGESIYLPKNSYVLITKLNTEYHQIYVFNNRLIQFEYIDLKYLSKPNKLNNIYDNGYGIVEFI